MAKLAHVSLISILLIGGCASAVGPDRHDLAGLLQTSPHDINALHCYDIPEEQTEFRCLYQMLDTAGVWTRQEVMVAIDGSTWVIIDGPNAPHRP